MSSWSRPISDTDVSARSWVETELYEKWEQKVKHGDPNDMVIVLTASSMTGVSGSGKTTAQTAIAESFDLSEGGYDAEEQGTLSGEEMAYQIVPGAPEGAAMVLEEAQGTPNSTGLNKRRGMKREVLDIINGVLANRDNRNTVIIVAQQLSSLDGMLLPMIDAWLLIRFEPSDPKGPLIRHHDLYVNDYELKSPTLRTPIVEELRWPELGASNENYQIMERKKQVAKQRQFGSDEEDEELDKDQQMTIAQALRDQGWSLQDIADDVDEVTFSRETIRKETVARDNA